MDYAVIEFSSGELEIVSISTLRDFDAAASLPVECICNWSTSGRKKATPYAVKVLRLGSSRKELQPLMSHLLDGGDVLSWNPNKELGKGCRDPEPSRKTVESDSESDVDYVLPPKDHTKSKKAKATASTATDILAKVRAKHLHPSGPSGSSTKYEALQTRIKELEAENSNLRAALAATEVLPAAVTEMRKLVETTRHTVRGREAQQPLRTPSPTTPSLRRMPMCEVQELPQPKAATTSTAQTESEKDAAFRNVVAMADRRAVTATKMACDILHGLYSVEFLASHTIAGGNINKASLDQEVTEGVIDAVKRRYPDANSSEIRQAMRQKCSNAVKALKSKNKE